MELKETLAELEVERKKLNKRRLLLLPLLLAIPILSFLFFKGRFHEGGNQGAIGGIMLSFMIYGLAITTPFLRITSKLKSALVEKFMLTYHPDIQFNYSTEKQHGKRLIEKSNLVRFSTSTEEDVLSGKMKSTKFYISEMRLERGSGDDKKVVFKGIIFEIDIKGKQFPHSEIHTNFEVWSNMTGKHKEHKDYKVFYNTVNEQAFEETLVPLLPFISHLYKENKSIRVKASGSKLTIMLENKIRFMDEPKLSTSKSFINKEYNANLARQLNTFLFIVESFANDLRETEVVEKLELKALEILKHTQPDEDRPYGT